MTFTTAVQTCFQKYATFSRRAARSEYWWFVLFYFIGGLIAGAVDASVFGLNSSVGVLGPIFALVMLLPTLAVAVRRLHDTNRSGWWLLLGLIPIVGFIVLLIWFITKGDDGSNQYGADPLA